MTLVPLEPPVTSRLFLSEPLLYEKTFYVLNSQPLSSDMQHANNSVRGQGFWVPIPGDDDLFARG